MLINRWLVGFLISLSYYSKGIIHCVVILFYRLLVKLSVCASAHAACVRCRLFISSFLSLILCCSMASVSMAPVSLTPGSLVPVSLAPVLLAPVSLAPRARYLVQCSTRPALVQAAPSPWPCNGWAVRLFISMRSPPRLERVKRLKVIYHDVRLSMLCYWHSEWFCY